MKKWDLRSEKSIQEKEEEFLSLDGFRLPLLLYLL
jgi:hypothetical protein